MDPHFTVTSAKLVSRREIAREIIELVFDIADGSFTFVAGQYVWVRVPVLSVPDEKGNQRAFSICSSSDDPTHVSIVFRKGPSGYKQTLLTLALQSEVEISGPFGFLKLPEDQRPIIFVAGGTGVTPFMSMIRHSVNVKNTRSITILYATHGADMAAFKEELADLSKQHPNIVFFHTVGKMTPEFIRDHTGAVENPYWYIAGPQGMVQSVAQSLSGMGVNEASICFDQYYKDGEKETEAITNIEESEKFKLAVDGVPVHIIITDTNGIIQYANPEAERVTGFTQSEIIGQTPRLWGGLMSKEFYETMWHTIKVEKKIFSGVITNRKKNHQIYTTQTKISPILSKDGELTGFIGTEEDITARIEAEREVEQTKVRDEAILGSIGDGLLVMDAMGRAIMTNKAFERITGYTSEDVKGKSLEEVLLIQGKNDTIMPAEERLMVKTLRDATGPHKGKFQFIRKDGRMVDLSVITSPIIIGGSVIGVVQVARDVTEETAIDRAKTEFVSLASHQLRTPLSTVNWYAEMLLSGDAGALTDKQKEYMAEIQNGNKRMVDLVNSLLNVSRIEMGTFGIEPEQVKISELVQSILDDMKAEVTAKQINIKTSYDDVGEITADPKLLRLIIQNLLTNSVRYSLPQGEVTLSVEKRDQDILFTVTDHGIGIPPAVKEKIFTKLFRADNARSAHPDGNGLGLYQVKNILTNAGGSIWFESTEGKGSTFYVTIPLSGMKKKEGTKPLA